MEQQVKMQVLFFRDMLEGRTSQFFIDKQVQPDVGVSSSTVPQFVDG